MSKVLIACSEHPTKPLMAINTQLNELGCADCFMFGKFKGHDSVPLEDPKGISDIKEKLDSVMAQIEQRNMVTLIRSVQDSLQKVQMQTSRLGECMQKFNSSLQTIPIPPTLDLTPVKTRLEELESKSEVERCVKWVQFRQQLETHLSSMADPSSLAILHQVVHGLDSAVSQLHTVTRTFIDLSLKIDMYDNAPPVPPTPPSPPVAPSPPKPPAPPGSPPSAPTPAPAAPVPTPTPVEEPQPTRSVLDSETPSSHAEIADEMAAENRTGVAGHLVIIPTCPDFLVTLSMGEPTGEGEPVPAVTLGPFRPDSGGKIPLQAMEELLAEDGVWAQRMLSLNPVTEGEDEDSSASSQQQSLEVQIRIEQPAGRVVFNSPVRLPIVKRGAAGRQSFMPVIDTRLMVFETSFHSEAQPAADMIVQVQQVGKPAEEHRTNSSGVLYVTAALDRMHWSSKTQFKLKPSDARFPPSNLPQVTVSDLAETPWQPVQLPYFTESPDCLPLQGLRARSGAAVLVDVSANMQGGSKIQALRSGLLSMGQDFASRNIPFVLGKWCGNFSLHPEVYNSKAKLPSLTQWVDSLEFGGGSDMLCAILQLLLQHAPTLPMEISDVHILCAGPVKPFLPHEEYPPYSAKVAPFPNRGPQYSADYKCGWVSFRRRFPHVNFHFHAVGSRSDSLSLSTMAMSGNGSSRKFIL